MNVRFGRSHSAVRTQLAGLPPEVILDVAARATLFFFSQSQQAAAMQQSAALQQEKRVLGQIQVRCSPTRPAGREHNRHVRRRLAPSSAPIAAGVGA